MSIDQQNSITLKLKTSIDTVLSKFKNNFIETNIRIWEFNEWLTSIYEIWDLYSKETSNQFT